MSGRPRKACERCNRQKLRCIGEKPVCDRCRRLNKLCLWADRSRAMSPTNLSPTTSNVAARRSKQVSQDFTLNSIPQVLPGGPSYTGIPFALVSQLIDTYFDCLYSASLLFHKATLLQDLQARTVKPYVILSICALASSFYQSPDSANYINNLRDNGFSREWAEHAASLLMSEGEYPDEDKVVSFTNLGLFWYSQGDWRRSLIHEGNAALNARLLGLSQALDGQQRSLAAELKCRRFWASFLFNQFVSEPAFPKITTTAIRNVKLPCSDDEYDRCMIPKKRLTIGSDERVPSTFSELIRIMSLWTEVYTLIKDSDQDLSSRLSMLNLLDARLRQWRENLPRDFTLSSEKLSRCKIQYRPNVLLIHIVYHQCLCALHSSIVPLFSLDPIDGLLPYLHSQRLSAQVAYENAREISCIMQANLAELRAADVYKWPGFVGYALYCSSAIQLPFLWCSKDEIRDGAQNNIKVNLELMSLMGRNWRYVSNLGTNVRTLYRYHSTDPITLLGEPNSLSSRVLAGTKVGTPEATSMLGQNKIIGEYGRAMVQGEVTTAEVDQPVDLQANDGLPQEEGPSVAAHSHIPPINTMNPNEEIPQGQTENYSGVDHHAKSMTRVEPSTSSHHYHSSALPITGPLLPVNEINSFAMSEEEQNLFMSRMNQLDVDLWSFNDNRELESWLNA